jgi:hypothetical protein
MRILFFLLIISAFFGQYLFLFNEKMHLIRLLPAFLIFGYSQDHVKLNRDAVVLLSYFTLYYFYTLIISLVNISVLKGNDLINLTVFYFFIVAVVASSQINPKVYFNVFKKTTLFFFCVSFSFWGYELLTHKHLRYSMAADFPSDYYFQPTTTFFINPNDFAAIFTLSVMYLLTFLGKEKLSSKILIAILISAEVAVCYTTQARLDFLAFLFFLIFYFNLWKLKTILGITLSMILIVTLTEKVELNWAGLLNYLDTDKSGSLGMRIQLYYYGLISVLYNYGFGFGVGGHHYFYTKVLPYHLTDPHNFILELWIGSGVLITFSYLLLNAYILMRTLQNGNKLITVQFCLYNFILLSSSSSLFLWPHYLFLVAYLLAPYDQHE